MIEEVAKVIAIDNGNIEVETTVQSTCSGCNQLDSCGSGQVAKAFGQKQVHYQLKSKLPVALGDQVLIGLSEKVLLTAAWQVYLLPLVGLFLASVLGKSFFEMIGLTHELFALVTGLLGGYFGFRLAQRLQHQQAKDKRWQVTLLRVMK